MSTCAPSLLGFLSTARELERRQGGIYIYRDGLRAKYRRPVNRPVARLVDNVQFDPKKLHVRFLDSSHKADSSPCFLPRIYTLTHNDITSELYLSIGPSVDSQQLGKLCTRVFRDEVVAHWKLLKGPSGESYGLHVDCHVSGGHNFMAPAAIRNWIFQQEMSLVPFA